MGQVWDEFHYARHPPPKPELAPFNKRVFFNPKPTPSSLAQPCHFKAQSMAQTMTQ